MFSGVSKKWFKSNNWQFVGSIPAELKKYIVIVGPHTSNWDFILGVAVRSALGLKHIKYLAKKELFMFPLGKIFRMLGGYPVDREAHNNMVDAVVALFNSKESFAITITPEGTREKVRVFKTGFYFISKKAAVPIVMVGFDIENKKIIISDPVTPTENMRSDFRKFLGFFANMKGIVAVNGVDDYFYNNMVKDGVFDS